MGGVIAWLAANSFRKKGWLKVLYTAHGFYFFKGAPLFYWLIYYPIEKLLARFTDGLITINNEDYKRAKKFNLKNSVIYKINGIGINNHKFIPLSDEEKNIARKNLGYSSNQFILIYAAEFIHRKNHRFIIDALPMLIYNIPSLKVIFAGAGEIMDETVAYAAVQDRLALHSVRRKCSIHHSNSK